MNRLALRLAAGAPRKTLPQATAALVPAWRRLQQSASGIRTIHTRLELPYDIEAGMGEFLNPAGLKAVAVDYQQGLLDRLNNEVKKTGLENKSVVQSVIDAAQDPDLIMTFNYASEALNNSFFLQSLMPPKEGTTHNEDAIGSFLMGKIRLQFGTLGQLKSVFSASVRGMFGTGWVWLVTDQYGQLAALPTFGTGTLLVRSQESVLRGPSLVVGEEIKQPAMFSASRPPPPPSPSSPTSGVSSQFKPPNPMTPSRSYSTPEFTATSVHDAKVTQQTVDMSKIGDKLLPLMCISVHEHAWVSAGYGVWGKEEYVKRFWSAVNWDKINREFELYAPNDPIPFRSRRS